MDQAKLLRSLTGIENDNYTPDNDSPAVLLTGLHDPPSYFVGLLLGLAGFRRYTGEDKSEWQFFVRYQGERFCIRDWKTITWSIEGFSVAHGDLNAAKAKAESLKKRLARAARGLDHALQPDLITMVERGQFALLNPYRHTYALYDYFREQAWVTLQHVKEVQAKTSTTPQEIMDHMNQTFKSRAIASHNACASVAFFFSHTELLLDVLFVLGSADPVTYDDFKGFHALDWSARFRRVLPLRTDRETLQIYEELLEIRRMYRNIPMHGFMDETALLVPVPNVGLVPISFDVASQMPQFWPVPMTEDIAERALEAFDWFDEWFSSGRVTQYAYLYAQTGLEIPFNEARRQKIRGWMTSREAFEQALYDEIRYRDYVLDQYQ